jgi:hypothetical protein
MPLLVIDDQKKMARDERAPFKNYGIPLVDDAGVPLYPELMVELDAIKRDRIGGLMVRRDRDQRPWSTYPRECGPDLSHMNRAVQGNHSRRRATQ